MRRNLEIYGEPTEGIINIRGWSNLNTWCQVQIGRDRTTRSHGGGEWWGWSLPCLSSPCILLSLPGPLLCARHLLKALLDYPFNLIPCNNFCVLIRYKMTYLFSIRQLVVGRVMPFSFKPLYTQNLITKGLIVSVQWIVLIEKKISQRPHND